MARVKLYGRDGGERSFRTEHLCTRTKDLTADGRTSRSLPRDPSARGNRSHPLPNPTVTRGVGWGGEPGITNSPLSAELHLSPDRPTPIRPGVHARHDPRTCCIVVHPPPPPPTRARLQVDTNEAAVTLPSDAAPASTNVPTAFVLRGRASSSGGARHGPKPPPPPRWKVAVFPGDGDRKSRPVSSPAMVNRRARNARTPYPFISHTQATTDDDFTVSRFKIIRYFSERYPPCTSRVVISDFLVCGRRQDPWSTIKCF